MAPVEAKVTSLEMYEPTLTIGVEEYEPYVGASRVEELKRLAAPLQGKRWANISSTLVGGGVAEILRSLVPLARGLGIDAQWYVIRGSEEFFQVTKKFHNLLQGRDQPLSLEEIFGAYLDTIDANASNTCIVSDLVVIHDPQPAALIMNGVLFGNILWRCHIDTSAPNRIVWRFLLPYINQCSGAIFTMPEFVGPGLQIPLYQITPCIDPRSEKNRPYSRQEALAVLEPLFQEHQIDPDRPILAAISRYDIHKNQGTIVQAFQRLREERSFSPPPYLIFLGNTATDDPEGWDMLATLKEQAAEDPDIHFWVNVENNDQVVGALMHLAQGFIHVSTREGFGLVVSEALWQGTPVIGSRVGGISKQVIDGKTGYLVDPLDVEAIAARMAWLLEDREEGARLGAAGREHVRQHFLLPELMRRYLLLLRFYTGISQEPPPFRLDDLSYSEIIHTVRTVMRCPHAQCHWQGSVLDRLSTLPAFQAPAGLDTNGWHRR
ncbi:MAG: glycosyltransferase [Nitrospinota bacterium]|nr:MAG: glycosyltransferase [Nitrospinota bacterium]